MNNNIKKENSGFLAELRRFFWPIEGHEIKKFIPLAAMMFCILFNYSAMRSIKDAFVVTAIGTEAIGFLKLYLVLPMAVLVMVLYSRLSNVLDQEKVFYVVTSSFIAIFAIYAFVLYPNLDYFHADGLTIDMLCLQYPFFKWFIKIGGNWSYALFYIASELWGSVVLSLLFWQLANKITKTTEAKRFYSMFGLIGNMALPLVGLTLYLLLNDDAPLVEEEYKFIPVISVIIFIGILVMLINRWVNLNVLTDPKLYDPSKIKSKKKKAKLSLGESFKMIAGSRYLRLLGLLVIAYGVSINLVEGVWKEMAKQIYSSDGEYAKFMGMFQAYQGVAAIIFMLIGSNILRRVSWKTAALLTPSMILITGLAFFSFIIFDQTIGLYFAAFFGTGPIALAVIIGTIQNVLSKATKYSLFDSTKEMAYIPLDDEFKTKGKAAVDVVGGRLGKSGGAAIQSTFFLLLPGFTFIEATPFFAGIFFLVVVTWIYAVSALSVEYQKELEKTEKEEQSSK